MKYGPRQIATAFAVMFVVGLFVHGLLAGFVIGPTDIVGSLIVAAVLTLIFATGWFDRR